MAIENRVKRDFPRHTLHMRRPRVRAAPAMSQFDLWAPARRFSALPKAAQLIVACLVLTFVCDSIVTSAEVVGAAIAPVTPFTGVRTLADPVRLFDGSAQRLADSFQAVRLWAAVGCVVTISLYTLGVAWVYKSMVRNFDMTVRKQTGQF